MTGNPVKLALVGSGALISLFLMRKVYRKATAKSRLRKAFNDKVVCITGASSGIGRELAIQAFEFGARLILVARRQHLLEKLRDDLLNQDSSRNRADISIVDVDLGMPDLIPGAAAQILEKYGRVDILINNAGVACRGSVENAPMDLHRRVMDVNYFSAVHLTKQLLPSLTSQPGNSIVAVSSLMGKIGFPYHASYSASKHAMQGFFDCLRPEVHEQGVNVLVASPGVVDTDIVNRVLDISGQVSSEPVGEHVGGMSAAACASRIMRGVADRKKDVVVTNQLHVRLFVFLGPLLPCIYHVALPGVAAQFRRQYKIL